ncbi:DUF1292 domain-containing protein [Paenibacillus crassostreae]|uniref:DUF1292 domain-containing protein n=1 Tax=Paenibacillus crassostreae TaxID=1763538 RepID=A0A167CI25_9BACL|nr:DUF1292 domain-containing protein [Paenibacillus crassostreae]AOZ91855.1 DUF1292 domain-containing protein [Paenibacillus crassostreae]OAB73222.1 hypothetical protein PNBC_14100 [Paenibacillus crassostreae]
MSEFSNHQANWSNRLKETFGPTVELEDEDGTTSVYDLTAEFVVGDESYAVLLNVDEDSDEYDILKIVTSAEGKLELVTIDDDEEWENIAELYDEMTFPHDTDI